MKNLNAFIEEQFDLVRMVGAEERLITKTLTFIVISEGPSFTENPFAFIFLNVQPQNLENVRVTLLNIPEILSADTVFGPYDIICPVKAKDRKNLEQVISNIQTHIQGIEGSMTAIVATRNM